ncbi:MAG: hypothetical protein OEW97_05730 [Gammaproteobacteria bacterium]|nr:hypothetical protein [Gammaproteobacteria bacterium]
MKKVIVIGIVVLFSILLLVNKSDQQDNKIVDKYPWQITLLPGGQSRVFGIVLNETTLKEVIVILKDRPVVALFESDGALSLEAYFKNVTLGGLTGSFIFTMDVTALQLNEIKTNNSKQKKLEKSGFRYELDMPESVKAEKYIVKSLNYIPTVQLSEEMIVKRFGMPEQKIALKNKELGWHYLYPGKGLDLIYKKEGKEVLQYVSPGDFNLLSEPLQSH